ncbi:hypothetical protein [Photobacterium sp. TY1-4]|uniref:hypothetical protein n=1 Tax=Photobacterium sp. TY1-4 TaxID=2899122 RepID=UPI0021C0CB8B|nr:hypothetical protein [Photobacterium sp. TY1-4]UXI02569.1 hypothetical protein NH461_07335 [Photobacterium sp. TY1-4]
MTLIQHPSLLPAEPVTLVRATYLFRQLNYYVELSNGSKGTVAFDSMARQQPTFADIIHRGCENDFYVSGDQLRWANGAVASAALIRARMKPSLPPARLPLTIDVAPQSAAQPKQPAAARKRHNREQAQMAQFSEDMMKQLHRQQVIQNINLALLAMLVLVLFWL